MWMMNLRRHLEWTTTEVNAFGHEQILNTPLQLIPVGNPETQKTSLPQL
jgi:hypothetical protein